jgi:hypothetical protein
VSPLARRWAAAAALVLLVAGAALAFGQVSGTFAIFTADTENPNTAAAGGWIPTPTNQTSSINNVSTYSTEKLTWTTASGVNPPNPNRVTGTTVLYADGGDGTGTASCPSTVSGYTSFSTGLSSGATVTGTDIPDWWCFAIESTSTTAGTWTTSDIATFPAQELFTPDGDVTLNNHGTTGRIDTNDTIIVTYNQKRGAWNGGNGTINVLLCTSGRVEMGTGTQNCTSTTPNYGLITGLGIAAQRTCSNSTTAGYSATAGTDTTTFTITLKGCTGTGTARVTGSGTFTPTGANLDSFGGQNVCEAAACGVSTSGDF